MFKSYLFIFPRVEKTPNCAVNRQSKAANPQSQNRVGSKSTKSYNSKRQVNIVHGIINQVF